MGHDKDMLTRTVSPFELEVEDWANKPPQPARWRRLTRVTCAAVVIVVACVAAGVTVFLTRRTTPTLSVPEVQYCVRLVQGVWAGPPHRTGRSWPFVIAVHG